MTFGKFIVIEGTDCSGKDTQTKKLAERLNFIGFPTKAITFPRYETPTGQIIGDCYLGKGLRHFGEPSWFGEANKVHPKIASAYYAADRFAHSKDIRKMIASNVNVICDRYAESNMGHQGGKIRDSKKREEFFKWLEHLEYGLFEIPKPDRVIFLYMPYQIGMELKKCREGVADGHESSPEHLKNAEESYLQLAHLYRWTKIDCAWNETIESLRSIEDISKEVFEKVFEILREPSKGL